LSKLDFLFSEESFLLKYLNKLNKLTERKDEIQSLLNIYKNDTDEKTFNELTALFNELEEEFNEFEENTLFSSKEDISNAFMEIQAGAGGIDAQDWVDILFKMYTLWFEKKKFIYMITDISNGEVAGFKFISMKIIGKCVYGWLKNETGIHRLVRKSPFAQNNKRHTSFASVLIYAENLDKNLKTLDQSELKIETFRSSGAGGQHVNKTDSAVRIIHIPTKITVQCQAERSQNKNKLQALNQIKMKINALKILNNAKETTISDKTSITWGNQIRSYVFDKSYVKDLRTNQEINNINFILNGNLDIFILSILKKS
jgi:peptide chain release factor 2